MPIVEYLQSLLASAGLTADKLPLVIGIASLAVAMMYARPFFGRLGRIVEAVFLRNWQLGLLGTTGIVLSLASGWTTWDGMKNFTGEPILSAMVTFGIQGVMLIVAWLIGESFATGMNQQVPESKLSKAMVSTDTGLKSALGLTLAGIALSGVAAVMSGVFTGKSGPSAIAFWLAAIGVTFLVLGLLIVAARAHTLRGYFDATRVIVRTAVLWVMFLACMATSVFFSFDSLFSTIFPASERVRAAELRAQNQVAGIVNDIGGTIVRGQLTATEQLFETKGWEEYDRQLSSLASAAGESKPEIEKYFQKQMEDKRSAIAEQQGRMTTAQTGQVGLANKKQSLSDELNRLKADRPSLSEDFSKRKGDVDAIMKDLDAKRVEAMAEARGVEGTGKIGEGAIFRQRKTEEAALKDKQKIAEERLRDAQKRFQSVDTRVTQIERELTLVDGEISKLKGEAQTAEQRIKLAEDAKTAEEGVSIDPARQIPAFEKARAEFRQTPKLEGLNHLQTMCAQLLTAMAANPAVRSRVSGIDCDPKTAAEAASRVFALNAGVMAFESQCAGGDKLARYKTADDLFSFARKCVQDSGLASKDTDELRQKINFIELNRDDKANRFVVTWNAFQDGNRLAYLSLAIAIAVDALVFMSGLFGANAVRSPLSDVPTNKSRSAEQLEGIMDNALLPQRFENARIVIEAMHADTSVPGYTAIVDLRELAPEDAAVVRRVLNAGATIGAVLRNPDSPAVYAIRPELYEYLAMTGARAFEKHGKLVQEDVAEKVRQGELEKMVRVALLPDEMANADTVLHYAHPMNASDGYMSQIILKEVATDDVRVVRRVLNAGAAHNAVRIQQGENQPYEIHADLYKTLSKIRARLLLSGANSSLQIGHDRVVDGGMIRENRPQISPVSPRKGLSDARSANGARGFGNTASNTNVPPIQSPTDTAHNHSAQRRRSALDAAILQTNGSEDLSDFDAKLDEHFALEVSNLEAQHIKYLRENADVIPLVELQTQLSNVMHFEPVILKALTQARAGLDESIDRAREAFNAFANEPPSAPARLHDVATTLHKMTVVLVLMPGQAYGNIIEAMLDALNDDHGAGKLNSLLATKRDLLHKHALELKTAYKNADNCWPMVANSLHTFAQGLVTSAANAENGRARMG